MHKPRKELPALVFQEIKRVKEREAQPKKRYRFLFLPSPCQTAS
jgi:hypothetical protein